MEAPGCFMCERVAGILDELFAPIARSLDGGKKIDEKDTEPLSVCMGKLMQVWIEMRPGSSNVGVFREHFERRQDGTG